MKKGLLLALAVLVLGINPFAAAPSEGGINVNAGISVVTGGSTFTGEKTDWSVGLSYDQSIENSLGYVVGANYKQHSIKYATYVVEAGLTYEVVDNIYAITALNFNFVTDETFDNSNSKSRLGYRIGFGYDINESISAELSFEQLNNYVDGFGNIKFDTIKVAAIYHF